jgi:hypothetical protein
VSEEARTALSSRLEAVAMQQDQFLILFAKEEDRVVELSLAASFSYLGPRCLFIKQLHTSAKVSSCGRMWNWLLIGQCQVSCTVFKNQDNANERKFKKIIFTFIVYQRLTG